MSFHPEIEKDLSASGITLEDLQGRVAGAAELAVCGVEAVGEGCPGYVIPYFSFSGKPLTHYRLVLVGDAALTAKQVERQPTDSTNHVYFPPGLPDLIRAFHRDYQRAKMEGRGESERPFILLTEGEKKAAAAIKAGLPCVALSGIYAWKNRVITLPENATIRRTAKGVKVRIPNAGMGTSTFEDESDSDSLLGVDEDGLVAVGLADVVNFCAMHEWDIILAFDTEGTKVHPNVQKAAARLGYELRHRGMRIARIRQWVLPGSMRGKVGLDTFLMHQANSRTEALDRIRRVQAGSIAFPRHPTPREFVDYQLRARMNRKRMQSIAITILSELEARGVRMRTEGKGELCYFDNKSKVLMPVTLGGSVDNLYETTFGSLLYDQFNIGSTDGKVLSWLGTQFTGEPGVQQVKTHKVLSKTQGDEVNFQVSDSHYVRITGDPNNPFEIRSNGDRDILFEAKQVSAVDPRKLEAKFYELLEQPVEAHWLDVWDTFDFRVPRVFDNRKDPSREKFPPESLKKLAAVLCYISPWLNRWRGLQLPIELVVGDSGSGKSSVCTLRQTILKGQSSMANMTHDIRDFYASISNEGALQVWDNVNFGVMGKDVHQKISDEFCRLITEQDPHLELRKYYTTNSLETVPITSSFVITSITRPFIQEDLMQRSAYFELRNIRGEHDSRWLDHQLERLGGRTGWLAHHLVVLHLFLKKVAWKKQWDEGYKTKHRLNHYEQTVRLMGSILGLGEDWVSDVIKTDSWLEKDYEPVDPDDKDEEREALKALATFAEQIRNEFPKDFAGRRYSARDISNWAKTHAMARDNSILIKPVQLGRFLNQNRFWIQEHARLMYHSVRGNRRFYRVLRPKESKTTAVEETDNDEVEAD